MSLSVISRPQGYILDTTSNTATISSSSGALFTKASHGLNTGDFIYVYSNLDYLNGYWYVNKVDANTFRVKEYSSASDLAFINSGTVTYYKSVLTHGWNCVHLPIIYRLKSDIWPTNGTDTARTITTFSNYLGYTYIVASGDIKSSGVASALDEVVLSGTSVDGVYKILYWFSDTNFVIDLAYSGSNVLSSGTVQFYYFNYCAKVKIFAGINAAHTWTAQNPYEEITELRLVPDASGIIKVNISQFVQAKIDCISNNSILETLPNNINAWCSFYITYAESYDDSDGYSPATYTSSYTDDSGTFEGYAANAILPFKTRSAGTLSQYVSGLTSATRQKWLTGFSRPTLFAGKYFDISYIKNTSASGDYIKVDRYSYDGTNYVLLSSTLDVITDNDQGIYRYAVSQTGTEKRIDLTYYNTSNVQLSETITIDVYDGCSNQDFYLVWLNYLGGYDYWNFTARKDYHTEISENKLQNKNTFSDWPNSYGEFADSIRKQTVRTGVSTVSVVSQFLTISQQDSIKLLFNSPLVQLCTSQYDRTTLVVDGSSLSIRKDQDKTRKLSFSVKYTNDLPSQSL